MPDLKDLPPELANLSIRVEELIDNLARGGKKVHVLGSSADTSEAGVLPVASKDIDYAIREVQIALTDFQNRKKIINADRVQLVEESPPSDALSETITWRLVKRCPARISQGRLSTSLKDGDRREWQPRARYVKVDPTHPNQRVVVMGQMMENVVEFTCWAKSNKAANTRALWFEDFMNIYRWYFKLKGISEVLFVERQTDVRLEDDTQGNWLKGRPMKYYFRTDRTFNIVEAELRDIILNLGLSQP